MHANTMKATSHLPLLHHSSMSDHYDDNIAETRSKKSHRTNRYEATTTTTTTTTATTTTATTATTATMPTTSYIRTTRPTTTTTAASAGRRASKSAVIMSRGACKRPRQSAALASAIKLGTRDKSLLVRVAIVMTVAVFLLAPSAPQSSSPSLRQGSGGYRQQQQQRQFHMVEGAKKLKKLAKTLKPVAKTLLFQQLTMRKNFIPLPVPIPVPIEINDPPVYLKGKPKYVNVYTKPKPTAPPVVKPTTVYHMPIYSPTYEYMSMDPMSSMYGQMAPLMYRGSKGMNDAYNSAASSSGSGSGSGSDSSSYSSSSSGSLEGNSDTNFNDYDDDSSSYYVGGNRLARRQGRLLLAGSTSQQQQQQQQRQQLQQLQHNMLARGGGGLGLHQRHGVDYRDAKMAQERQQSEFGGRGGDDETEVAASSLSGVWSPDDDEFYDHVDDDSNSGAQDRSSNGGAEGHKRGKRQVYYESGYDGNTNCEGFPLEINIRSRIKLDQIFPIHGKSQMKKCIKLKKNQNVIKIPAFATRIDKSSTLRRHAGSLEQTDQDNFVSSYFTKTEDTESMTRKPFLSSLLEHEAEEYGYKLSRPEQISLNDQADKGCLPERISYVSLFRSTSGRTVTNFSQLPNRHKSYSKQISPGEASLREQLNNTVLRSTRTATTNACRRYPSLSSRNILDKYAHMFGLETSKKTSDSANITDSDVLK